MQEIKFPKNRWTFVTTTTAKTKLAPNFIDLVQTAYEKTPEGSFVNTLKDVLSSEWIAFDFPGEKSGNPNCVIFYRKNRSNEPWNGWKIQGIGHDSTRPAIDKVIKQVKTQLKKDGWWVEASDALEHLLYKDKYVKYVNSEILANQIFPNSSLKMLDDNLKPGRYSRKVGGHVVKETIFGKPKLR